MWSSNFQLSTFIKQNSPWLLTCMFMSTLPYTALSQETKTSDKEVACAYGKERNVDTDGQCCWPGQAWNGKACVGIPTTCPKGWQSKNNTCELPPCSQGMSRQREDQLLCCYPDQAYSSIRGICVGTPSSCPGELTPQGDTCGCSEGSEAQGVACVCKESSLDVAGTCKPIPKDKVSAHTFYQEVCDEGHMSGCHRLAMDHEFGIGTSKDINKANALYQSSCDAGYMESCYHLAHSYTYGHGVAKDLEQVFNLHTKACDGKYLKSCYRLVRCYAGGEGVTRDVDHAIKLLQEICDDGMMLACRDLGYAYWNGEHVPKDLNRAHELYTQACEGGNEMACVGLRAVKKSMEKQAN